MKKILIIILLANCIMAYAQYKPLKSIIIDDVYISQSGSTKSYNIGNTRETYTSYFNLGFKAIEHQKGIKDYDLGYDRWGISARLDNDDTIALEAYTKSEEALGGLHLGTSILKIFVGGTMYQVTTWYYSPGDRYLMMDISKSITEHISISGLQGIYANDIEIIAYPEIEQELWRRAAKDVYSTRKNL
jgi:hypothetical protein